MPRRKRPVKVSAGKRGRPRTTSRQQAKRPTLASIRWTESYTSLLMGVVVVIVAVLFVVSFLRQTHHVQETTSTATSITPVVTVSPSELKPSGEKTYTVQEGDDLWHISEKFYKSGYNWVDIAKANNLSDPGAIFSGNKLIIPNVSPKIATVTPTTEVGQATAQTNAITGDSYTVKSGDDLWNIAVRAYADGYRWVDIARANNLENPDLIFSGNVLKIPR